MLLFDSLHSASYAMGASQLGMQVVGQNLANANTPNYVREQMILETGTSRKINGGQTIGTGVQIGGVVQVIDQFLEERLRTATSDALSSSTQQQFYTQLEALINETTDYDLSTSLSDFFNSIDNILNKPEDTSYRKMTVSQGQKLAEDIQIVYGTILGMRQSINTSVEMAADEINKLLKEIEELNVSITQVEAANGSQALGLRDRRLEALTELSKHINIKTSEDGVSGAVSIYCGSDILLMDGHRQEVSVGYRRDEGDVMSQAILCVGDTGTPLDVRSGVVHGLYQANSEILGGYARQLDEFAYELIRQFNDIYSSGQGLTGYSELTSLTGLDDPSTPISTAGLDFPIENGGFKIQVYNNKTGVTTDTYIPVTVHDTQEADPFSLKASPVAQGTSLADIADAINAIDGLKATVNLHGQLEITTDSSNIEFAFADDNSGFLTAMGLNTFFTGSGASSIGVNANLAADPMKFAASSTGVGKEVDNGVILAAMGITPNSALGGKSFESYYEGIVSETMLAGATTKSKASSDVLYQQSLQTQRDSISGVNIDEETILMMTYQRMFQANSRLVTMINDMLTSLLNI